ncbi:MULTISPECIES: DUF4232 domain-containing protein [unclassified Streptomyces]|uniref:DUF4232 domain-containing protein n=1 Tax=unclassified Streptomyces TaxID=2593676 RepID=UPI000DBA6FBB|nr:MULTISPECIES: DUF4232 domain-containing protein [unclassified Streptomyces]MYT70102.1 DUF4232 domain-containing protein [Streptomyces sp. SID8367]RAJ88678.1 uncharacterized protein DUF4232 [Streptomyces sp. PsTaAH-137]
MTRTNLTRATARTAVLATAAAVLSLTLTACSGGADGKSGGVKDEGAAATKSASAAADGTSKAAAADSDTTDGTTAATTTKTNTTKTTAKTKTPECKVTSLGYTLKRKNPEQQGDHLLITAVNRSGSACTVQKFPVVTPGGANGDVPVAKDDVRPAQPVVVPAGGTVYSALPVYQEVKAEDDYFTSIRLSLVMNDADASGAFVTLKTPGEVEYAGKRADGIEVLSWNTRMPYAN